tara:strand:- start:585 stop:980 length:396 start_codon:yes stop_codon:yes gene_type:complete
MDFRAFLMELSEAPIRVVASNLDFSVYAPIDLSIGNIELEEFDIKCSTSWIKYINSYLKSHQKSIAFGGYLERLNLYDRSDYFHQSSTLKSRNIYLGFDFGVWKKLQQWLLLMGLFIVLLTILIMATMGLL